MSVVRCFSLAVVVGLAVALAAVSAMAGDYHAGTQLVCSDCHVMHYSLSHDFNGTDDPGGLSGGPNPRMLRAPEVELCLTCHDGQSTAPDVFGANTGTDYVREAGALNDGAETNYETWKGHTLGTTDTAPGGTWDNADGLDCGDCHGAHNSPSNSARDVNGHTRVNPWRNLSRRAGGSTDNYTVSYEVGSNTGEYDVFETDATLGQISTHYSYDNSSLNEPVTTMSGMGQWCMKCHPDFHGDSTAANMHDESDWLRHPAADADLSELGSSKASRWDTLTNHVKVMMDPASTDTTATPTCTSCHKAHGNQNPFGLIYMSGTGDPTEEGDDGTEGIRDLCRQCHSQGTPY